MLQDLARYTGAAGWAIASMLFFIVVFAIVSVRVARARPDELAARARLALDGDDAVANPRGDHG